MNVDLDPPRWPNGPPICPVTNLPAFPDRAALDKFFKTLPAVTVQRVGLCSACGHYHAEAKSRPPSGATSGTGRKEYERKASHDPAT